MTTCIAMHSPCGKCLQETILAIGSDIYKQGPTAWLWWCFSSCVYTMFLCRSDYGLEVDSGAAPLSTKSPSILGRIEHVLASSADSSGAATIGLLRSAAQLPCWPIIRHINVNVVTCSDNAKPRANVSSSVWSSFGTASKTVCVRVHRRENGWSIWARHSHFICIPEICIALTSFRCGWAGTCFSRSGWSPRDARRIQRWRCCQLAQMGERQGSCISVDGFGEGTRWATSKLPKTGSPQYVLRALRNLKTRDLPNMYSHIVGLQQPEGMSGPSNLTPAIWRLVFFQMWEVTQFSGSGSDLLAFIGRSSASKFSLLYPLLLILSPTTENHHLLAHSMLR
jgi:hypothetical protein